MTKKKRSWEVDVLLAEMAADEPMTHIIYNEDNHDYTTTAPNTWYPADDNIHYWYPYPGPYTGGGTNQRPNLICEICNNPIELDGEFSIRLGKGDYIHHFCSKKHLAEYLRKLLGK